MAIAQNPKRNRSAASITIDEQQVDAFINANPVGQSSPQPTLDPVPEEAQEESQANKKPIMVRVDPELLKRIDRAAKRLGISRSAFIVSSTAERLERME
jgi:predicted HicB family RNase H-like nuclease